MLEQGSVDTQVESEDMFVFVGDYIVLPEMSGT